MLIADKCKQEIDKLKSELSKEFAMKDLGIAKHILGLRIERKNDILTLSQEEYVKKVLNKFYMKNEKPISTSLAYILNYLRKHSPTNKQDGVHMNQVPYGSAIGSLMYPVFCTRLDITHAIRVVSKYMDNLGKQH